MEEIYFAASKFKLSISLSKWYCWRSLSLRACKWVQVQYFFALSPLWSYLLWDFSLHYYKSLLFFIPCPIHNTDGRGFPVEAKTRVCPTCRGIGKVSFLKLHIDNNWWIKLHEKIHLSKMTFFFITIYKISTRLQFLHLPQIAALVKGQAESLRLDVNSSKQINLV